MFLRIKLWLKRPIMTYKYSPTVDTWMSKILEEEIESVNDDIITFKSETTLDITEEFATSTHRNKEGKVIYEWNRRRPSRVTIHKLNEKINQFGSANATI